ncbi:MAG: hypothetical protein IPG85_16970 [Bacteroidetes bacterium]|nr:hypothetical protein [Bacteroidota bacterium]
MIVFNAGNPGNLSIVESANNICQGTSVTYTASITNGAPSYQWIVNGTNVGTNSNTYTYIPNNVDIVACQLTSTANCAYPVNVTSNLIIMYVNMVNVPSVTINQIDTNICEGSAIACLASYSNAGNNPVKRWIVNGDTIPNSNINPYYHNNSQLGDTIICEITSNDPCSNPNIIYSLPVLLKSKRLIVQL